VLTLPFMTCLFGMQDSGKVLVPKEFMTGLLARDTSQAMADLAKRAVRDNDPVSAELYEKQANVHWLKDHAHVMQYPAHKRRALPPLVCWVLHDIPSQIGNQDHRWDSREIPSCLHGAVNQHSQWHQCQLRSWYLRSSTQHSPRGSTLCNRPMCSPSQRKRSQRRLRLSHRPSTQAQLK